MTRFSVILLLHVVVCAAVYCQDAPAAPKTVEAAARTHAASAVKKPDPSAFELVIENLAGKQTRLRFADLAKLKRLTAAVNDHGKDASFEGYSLVDILKLGGVEFSEAMRGKNLTSYVLVEAADKYQVVFSLTELNPDFTGRVVIVADKRDGAALSDRDGPLKLVVPGEKKGARSVRGLVSFKVVRAAGAIQ